MPATPKLNHNKIPDPNKNIGVVSINGITPSPSKNSKSEDIKLLSFPA